jgi:hypothetical protein
VLQYDILETAINSLDRGDAPITPHLVVDTAGEGARKNWIYLRYSVVGGLGSGAESNAECASGSGLIDCSDLWPVQPSVSLNWVPSSKPTLL